MPRFDGDGRQSSNSITLTVVNNLPTIACTPNGGTIEATGPGGALFSINADVADLEGDKLTVRFLVDGTERQSSALLTPPSTASYSNPFPLGNHTYEAQVGDGLGSASCMGTFSIVDTTPPSIVLTPGDITWRRRLRAR